MATQGAEYVRASILLLFEVEHLAIPTSGVYGGSGMRCAAVQPPSGTFRKVSESLTLSNGVISWTKMSCCVVPIFIFAAAVKIVTSVEAAFKLGCSSRNYSKLAQRNM